MHGYLEGFVAKIVSDLCKINNLQSIDLSETKFVVLCPENKRTKKVLHMFIKRHILPGNFWLRQGAKESQSSSVRSYGPSLSRALILHLLASDSSG